MIEKNDFVLCPGNIIVFLPYMQISLTDEHVFHINTKVNIKEILNLSFANVCDKYWIRLK